jgi:hypothetical protein
MSMSLKNEEVLDAHLKIIEREPKKHKFGILKSLAQEIDDSAEEKNAGEKSEPIDNLNDKDQRLFFGKEFSDNQSTENYKNTTDESANEKGDDSENLATKDESKLIDYDEFDEFKSSSSLLLPSQLLMNESLFTQATDFDLLGSLNPTMQANNDLLSSDCGNFSSNSKSKDSNNTFQNKNASKKSSDVKAWFELFSDLDPLNQQKEVKDASDNLHAA